MLFLALLTSDDRAERGTCTNPHVRKSSVHWLHVSSALHVKTQIVGFPPKSTFVLPPLLPFIPLKEMLLLFLTSTSTPPPCSYPVFSSCMSSCRRLWQWGCSEWKGHRWGGMINEFLLITAISHSCSICVLMHPMFLRCYNGVLCPALALIEWLGHA